VTFLYGNWIADREKEELLRRLRGRGTFSAEFAANTISRPAARYATRDSAVVAREAILRELREWPRLEEVYPTLAAVRDWLGN
jgi:hypothetical protein